MLALNWPNRITIIRILLIGPFVIALLHLREPGWGEFARRSALVLFFLMAVSDGLDGWLARRLRQESMAGRILDPVADKLLILFSMLLLAAESTAVPGARIPPAVAVIAIGKDIIVTVGFCVVYLTTSRLYIEPRRSGKWCTAAQLAMILAVLLAPDLPRPLGAAPRVLWYAATALALAAIVQYYLAGVRFIDAHEPRPAERGTPVPSESRGRQP